MKNVKYSIKTFEMIYFVNKNESITLAAEEMNTSLSNVRYRLDKARSLFGDDIFTFKKRGKKKEMIPTDFLKNNIEEINRFVESYFELCVNIKKMEKTDG